MLSIDEAIQKENETAEEKQKIVDTGILCDDISLSQLFCGNTEVIEEHLLRYRKCVEYHKQLAELLKELKFLGQWKSDVMDEFCRYDCNSVEEAWHYGYNKAIDDFAGRLIRYVDCGHLCSPTEMRWSDLTLVEMVKKLAEQLKAGEKNE